jgi:hypothetical protein
MLWSGNDDLIGVTIADGEHPGAATLADDRTGLPMEAAVRHTFLDAGFYDNMDPVANLEPLDNGGNGR